MEENKNFLRKEMIFRKKFPLDARMAVVTNLKPIFWIKTPIFLSQSRKRFETLSEVEILCNISNIFLLKVFQGYIGYNFDNFGERFRWNWKKRHRILKKNSKLFSFEKRFSLICSSGHNFSVLATLMKKFCHCPKNFTIHPKNLEFSTFFLKTLPCKLSSWHIEFSFDNPAEIF